MAWRFEDAKNDGRKSDESKSKTQMHEGGLRALDGDSRESGHQRDGRDEQNAPVGVKTRNSEKEWFSDTLATACDRLNIDDAPLGESVFHRVDAGASEGEAVRMTLVEYLQRRGLYHGELRRLVDSGLVFQMRADE